MAYMYLPLVSQQRHYYQRLANTRDPLLPEYFRIRSQLKGLCLGQVELLELVAVVQLLAGT